MKLKKTWIGTKNDTRHIASISLPTPNEARKLEHETHNLPLETPHPFSYNTTFPASKPLCVFSLNKTKYDRCHFLAALEKIYTSKRTLMMRTVGYGRGTKQGQLHFPTVTVAKASCFPLLHFLRRWCHVVVWGSSASEGALAWWRVCTCTGSCLPSISSARNTIHTPCWWTSWPFGCHYSHRTGSCTWCRCLTILMDSLFPRLAGDFCSRPGIIIDYRLYRNETFTVCICMMTNIREKQCTAYYHFESATAEEEEELLVPAAFSLVSEWDFILRGNWLGFGISA